MKKKKNTKGGKNHSLSFTSQICNWDKMISLNEKSRITLMLGWAEVYLHFFDFFHVVFVACCCNPCEAFKMFIGEAVSLFPLYSVHGWECWLASVCAHKEGHHFLHKWLQSGKIFFRHQTPEVTNTCSEFNFENVFCLQFYHFTFYSSTLSRAEKSDSWSERWHIYV